MITHVTSAAELDAGGIEIQGDAYRHLFRARRLERGTTLRLVDGAGRSRWGEVVRLERRRAFVELGGPAPANEPSCRLELVVATLRRERASWLVEKATELGVAAVRFLATARAPRTYGDGTLERLGRVARAAVEQCHRSRLPEISGVHAWEELPALLEGATGCWFLDPKGPTQPAWDAGELGSVAVLVGPEGGWSDAEKEALGRLRARPAALGPRVLRIETAALAAAARILLPA